MLRATETDICRNGRSIIIAHDHGLERGPTTLEPVPERADPSKVFDMATHDAVTGLAVQKGVAEIYYPSYDDDVNLVAKLNGKTSMTNGDLYSPKNWSVDYAKELGADAIGYTIYSGSNRESDMLEDFRTVQERAREEELPIVMWSYPRGQGVNDHDSPDAVAYAARIGLELGADFAKIKYPGTKQDVEWSVKVAGKMPVLMSGGATIDTESFIHEVEAFMSAGGTGLTVGRNIWQRDDPFALLDQLEQIVYEDASVADVI